MQGGRLGGVVPISQENPLWISWHDTNLIPLLNPTNILDYFSEKTNPFYDRTCNNEIVKMQRQNLQQLENMTGIEYVLLHVQEPILYVIRKQHRHSLTELTPLADYYIIAGIVYQAPDLASVFNSRLLSTVHHLQSAFEEASSYSRYHQNKGYSWDFTSNKALSDKSKSQTKKEEKTKEEPSSYFQRKRVDMLLGELLKKFPLPMPTQYQQHQQHIQNSIHPNITNKSDNITTDLKTDIKQEPLDRSPNVGPISENTDDIKIELKTEMKPPPEKKIKL